MNNQTTGINTNALIRYLNININLFYLIFGNIGNIFKILFFLQKPLRTLPCTVYIVFATICDCITLNNLPVLQLLIHLYPDYHWIQVTVDWSDFRNKSELLPYLISNYDIVMCKLRTYLHVLSVDLSAQMLLFASINRFCFTYLRKKRRKGSYFLSDLFCHFPHVRKLCFVSSVLYAAISIHHIFNFTVSSSSEGCIPRNIILWTVWILSLHCFLLPILMITFGVLTLYNLRRLSVFCHCFYPHRRRRRVKKDHFIEMCSQCTRCQNSIQYKIDRQLTSMIITEIIVTTFTSIPYGTYALYHLIYGNPDQKDEHMYRSEWISIFIRMTMYFEASCGFYIYLITLTSLRKRFCKQFVQKFTSIHFSF